MAKKAGYYGYDGLSKADRLKLTAFRAIPDFLLPDLKGKLIVDGYLNSGGAAGKSFSRKVLSTPGANRSLYRYLKGSGKGKVPDIVAKHLGEHLYTGPAKLLSRIPFVRNIVIERVLENTLPRLGGTTSLARQFLEVGGRL